MKKMKKREDPNLFPQLRISLDKRSGCSLANLFRIVSLKSSHSVPFFRGPIAQLVRATGS